MSRKRINNILFLIGIVAVAIMLFTFDVSPSELWGYICKAGYWLLPIVALWGVLYMMNAWAWHIIIRGSGPCPVGYAYVLRLTLTGFALNYTTPVGLLGGEPYKIMEMTPHIGVRRATSSVLLFSMMHVFAHFCFWATSVVVYVVMASLRLVPINAATGIILTLTSVFCGAGIYMFIRGYRHGMVRGAIRLLGRLPGLGGWARRFGAAHQEDLAQIDNQIAQLHSQDSRTFYTSLIIEYLGRACQSFEILFMLLPFGAGGSLLMLFAYSYLILSFTSLFANLLGFLPLQLGGREGGFALSVSQLGLTGAAGLCISILCRVRELFWAVIGLALMKLRR
jgi:hypothetical protein